MRYALIGVSLLLAVAVSAQDAITVDAIVFGAGATDAQLTVRLAANASSVTAMQVDVSLVDGVTAGPCAALFGRKTDNGVTGWSFGEPRIGKPDPYTGLDVAERRIRAIYLPENVLSVTAAGYVWAEPMPVGPLFTCAVTRDMELVLDGYIDSLACYALGSTFDARQVPMTCEGPIVVAGCQVAPGSKGGSAWAVVTGGLFLLGVRAGRRW